MVLFHLDTSMDAMFMVIKSTILAPFQDGVMEKDQKEDLHTLNMILIIAHIQ